MKRLFHAALCAAVTAAMLLVPSAANAAGDRPPESEPIRHCELTVIGVNPDGSFETTPMVCRDVEPGSAAARSTAMLATGVLARHYSGFNRTGSVLTVNGSVCGGGWLNLPVGWVNQVASTYSHCNVTHHSSYYQTGATEVVWAPGGNLGPLAYGAASTTYW